MLQVLALNPQETHLVPYPLVMVPPTTYPSLHKLVWVESLPIFKSAEFERPYVHAP